MEAQTPHLCLELGPPVERLEYVGTRFCSVVYLGELSPKKGLKGHLAGGPREECQRGNDPALGSM